jgi:hypothetical protein
MADDDSIVRFSSATNATFSSSVSRDSTHHREQRAESLTRSLSWAAWHSKKPAHTASQTARDPARARDAPASARAAKRSRTAFACQSVLVSL